MKRLKYLLVFSLCSVLLLAAGCGSAIKAEPSAAQGKAAVSSTTQNIVTQSETSTPKANEKLNPYFTAKVVEVTGSQILVEPLAGEEELKTADKITVSTDVVSTVAVPQLETGSLIRIVYNGEIAESYPAQINTVFAIYLCDANGNIVDK